MISYIPKWYLAQAFTLFKIQKQQKNLNFNYIQSRSTLFQSRSVFSFFEEWDDVLAYTWFYTLTWKTSSKLWFLFFSSKPILWFKHPTNSWENNHVEVFLSSFLFTEWKQLRKKQKKIVSWYWEQGRLILGTGQEAVVCGSTRNSLSLTHRHTHTFFNQL